MNNYTPVCGWCGQPLDHRGTPPEGAETCEQAYGNACPPALNYQSQLIHEQEMRAIEDESEAS